MAYGLYKHSSTYLILKKAVLESYRILKNKGCFINYSFNNQPIVRALYKVMKKSYPVDEYVDGQFFYQGPQSN